VEFRAAALAKILGLDDSALKDNNHYCCYRQRRSHYVFKYPRGRSIPNKTKFAPGFDNHSTGGLIVVAPSIHVSDNQYQWLKGHSSFDKTLAEAPEWLLKLMEREEVLLTPFEGRSIVAGIKEGSRNSTLTSLAGTMRARGMTEEGIYTALLAENNARSQSSA